MTVPGFLILFLIGAIIGIAVEATTASRFGPRWIGAIVVGLVGGWIGHGLLPVGPIIAGLSIAGAVVGAIGFVLLLKLLTARRVAVG